MKLILTPFTWLFKQLRNLIKSFKYASLNRKLQKHVDKLIVERKRLRKDINTFLREYFGVDGQSDFIPPGYKNSEEVRVAVTDKFQKRMTSLNVKYTDIFK